MRYFGETWSPVVNLGDQYHTEGLGPVQTSVFRDVFYFFRFFGRVIFTVCRTSGLSCIFFVHKIYPLKFKG